MSKRIGLLDLQAEINSVLNEYGDVAREAVTQTVKEVTKLTVADLKTAGSFENRTGAYRKDWTSQIEQTRTGSTGTVFNRNNYYLTHLLEFGHAKRNGGRTQEFAHIEPAQNNAGDDFIRILEEKL